MKRSEMIDKIMEVIDGDDSYPLAKSILKKIEELGMLPPVIPGEYDPVPTVTPTGNHEYSWKRGWEVE